MVPFVLLKTLLASHCIWGETHLELNLNKTARYLALTPESVQLILVSSSYFKPKKKKKLEGWFDGFLGGCRSISQMERTRS